MASTAYAGAYSCLICKIRVVSVLGLPVLPLKESRRKLGNGTSRRLSRIGTSTLLLSRSYSTSKESNILVPECSLDSNSSNDKSPKKDKIPFGYTRKDVLLIGLGLTVAGYGLKSGLELFGVDSLQAGNVVQLVMVLGLTVGWISTYIFRVSNKEMTYAQQLRQYERKVMEKRLESLTEAELQALLEQVEEEKLAKGKQV
ncbi:unnamed protein product [Cuscuta epithymum]|uniref:MAR-binding filament-like protein 1-1 n=1 Tax=Cuscuta epithymum TaxID=186058 RepID=A0AAV0F151_9ASTE|nr:unnamed protein product [Cuscuta epithymum]